MTMDKVLRDINYFFLNNYKSYYVMYVNILISIIYKNPIL